VPGAPGSYRSGAPFVAQVSGHDRLNQLRTIAGEPRSLRRVHEAERVLRGGSAPDAR
jgi:hypothetical protein